MTGYVFLIPAGYHDTSHVAPFEEAQVSRKTHKIDANFKWYRISCMSFSECAPVSSPRRVLVPVESLGKLPTPQRQRGVRVPMETPARGAVEAARGFRCGSWGLEGEVRGTLGAVGGLHPL